MSEATQRDGGEAPPRKGLSVGTRLLLALNLTVVAFLGAFLAWDYASQREALLARKRATLGDQAAMLAVFLATGPPSTEAMQEAIDRVCLVMLEGWSPGHHIAVRAGEHVLQTSAHHRPSPEMYQTMRQAAGTLEGIGATERGRIVVGRGVAAGLEVFVSAFISDIERTMREHLIRRVGIVVSLTALLALLVSWQAHRLVTMPLMAVVGGVRRLSAGEFGVQVPPSGPVELGFLAQEFNRTSRALDEAERRRRQGMERARNIQRNLLPEVGDLPGIAVRVLYEPAEEVAGDYYDVFNLPDGSTLLCLADISGHGVPAAMGAAMLKALTQTRAEQESDPARLLGRINRAYAEVVLPDEFATMFLALLDPAGGTLRYASAGHEPAHLLRRSGEYLALGATGFPLGMSQDGVEWDTRETPVAGGDVLVLLTDGAVEAVNAEGAPFGRERLQRLLAAERDGSLARLAETARRALEAHCEGTRRADDITLLFAELAVPQGAFAGE